MNALPLILFFLAVIAIGYRYYSAFLAAKVMALDDARVTPAHRFEDGQNYVPTNKWVLFGHHFAAISGAGPLIGPVLAAQFGYLPGLLWLAFGVVLAGATHDFVILASSVRRNGKSLAAIARSEISPLASFMARLAILFVVVIALAGLGLAVVNALADSPWGTFTIFLTIPIALVLGLYLHKSGAPNAIRNGSVAGALAVLAAVIAGHAIPGSPLAHLFTLTKPQITFAIAAYAPSARGTSVKCEGPAAGAGVTGAAPIAAKKRKPVSNLSTLGILAVLGTLSPILNAHPDMPVSSFAFLPLSS